MPYGYGQDNDFRPFTGPYTRALEMQDFVEGIKFKREQREHQRRQWQMEMQDRQRAQAIQDFQTQLTLQNIGASPAEAGATPAGDLAVRQAFDRRPEVYRPLVTSPTGGQYRLPSEEQKVEREARLSTAKARSARAGDIASGKLVRVKVPGFGENAAQDIFVDANQYGETINQIRSFQQKVKGGNIVNPHYEKDDQTGKSYLLGIDADTQQPVRVEMPGSVTPKQSAGGAKLYP